MARSIRRYTPSLSRYAPNPSLNEDIGQFSTRYKQQRTNKALDTAVDRAQQTYEAYAPRMSAWQQSAQSLSKQYAAANAKVAKGSVLYKRYQQTQQAFAPLEAGWKEARTMKVGKFLRDPISGAPVAVFPGEYRKQWWARYGTQYTQTRGRAGIAQAAFEQQANAAQRLYGRYTGVTQRIKQAGTKAKRAYNVYEQAVARRNAGYYPV